MLNYATVERSVAMVIFPDGRAIVENTEDTALAMGPLRKICAQARSGDEDEIEIQLTWKPEKHAVSATEEISTWIWGGPAVVRGGWNGRQVTSPEKLRWR